MRGYKELATVAVEEMSGVQEFLRMILILPSKLVSSASSLPFSPLDTIAIYPEACEEAGDT